MSAHLGCKLPPFKTPAFYLKKKVLKYILWAANGSLNRTYDGPVHGKTEFEELFIIFKGKLFVLQPRLLKESWRVERGIAENFRNNGVSLLYFSSMGSFGK